MNSNSRLGIDISSLWKNEHNLFILRFRDINITHQKILAQRIKKKSTIWTTRKGTEPSKETIFEILYEINPTIFSEHPHGDGNSFSPFAKYATYQMAGWEFKRICQAIYWLTIKKISPENPLKDTRKIKKILQTTSTNYPLITSLITNQTHPDNSPPPLNHEEVGIQEIGQAGGQNQENDPSHETTVPTFAVNYMNGTVGSFSQST